MILGLDKHFTVDVSGKPSKSKLTIKGPVIIYRLRGRRIISGITRFLGEKKWDRSKGGITETFGRIQRGTTQICLENEGMGGSRKSSKVISEDHFSEVRFKEGIG